MQLIALDLIHLHMLRMFTDAFDELVWFEFANANVVDCREQWESKRNVSDEKIRISREIQGEFMALWLFGVTHLSSMLLPANMWLTSLAVIGPCNFWPFNISVSSCSIVLPLVTYASDTLRLRPPVTHTHTQEIQ